MRTRTRLFCCFALIALPPGQTQPEPAVVSTALRGNVHLLKGRGGNIALFAGEGGALLVDNQFAPRTAMIQKAVATITSQPVRWVINTHWHFDHSDGNENFGAAGAIIVAQENARRHMETGAKIDTFMVEQRPYKPIGLPAVTFAHGLVLHRGGERIEVVYPDTPAHTDGDVFVFFHQANIVHAGDVFVRYGLPFIDTHHGGSLNGTIKACEYLLGRINDETQIIPGHGALARKPDLARYTVQLRTARDRLAALLAAGKKPDEIVNSDPLKDIDLKESSVITRPVFILLCLESMTREQRS